MKKYLNLLSVLVLSSTFAQTPEKPKSNTTTTTTTIQTTTSVETDKPTIFIKKHEVKIGAVQLIVGPIFEATYEYVYSKDFTFGGAIKVNGSKFVLEEEFGITPFARFYFTESKEYGAYGFFVEGFAKYYSGKTEVARTVNFNNFSSGTYIDTVAVNGTALGFSLGKKWVNNSGFVLEGLLGVGRKLGAAEGENQALFRGDLSIGYRF